MLLQVLESVAVHWSGREGDVLKRAKGGYVATCLLENA